MKYLRIRNWTKFQQCDRSAPWIKLYTDLLQNYDFLNQTDNFKASFCCILMYVGKVGNKIPNDAGFLGRIFDLDEDAPLEKLIEVGFLEEASEDDIKEQQNAQQKQIDNRRKKDREAKKKARLNQTNDKSETENKKSELPETETETETELSREDQKKSYACEGKVIRLTVDDFETWEKRFPELGDWKNLMEILRSRDHWLSQQSKNDQKKWFVTTERYLASEAKKMRETLH